jgi:hypothetical protein
MMNKTFENITCLPNGTWDINIKSICTKVANASTSTNYSCTTNPPSIANALHQIDTTSYPNWTNYTCMDQFRWANNMNTSYMITVMM